MNTSKKSTIIPYYKDKNMECYGCTPSIILFEKISNKVFELIFDYLNHEFYLKILLCLFLILTTLK
jgi:hypothetical protein